MQEDSGMVFIQAFNMRRTQHLLGKNKHVKLRPGAGTGAGIGIDLYEYLDLICNKLLLIKILISLVKMIKTLMTLSSTYCSQQKRDNL